MRPPTGSTTLSRPLVRHGAFSCTHFCGDVRCPSTCPFHTLTSGPARSVHSCFVSMAHPIAMRACHTAATPCDEEFTGVEGTNHFSANCSTATAHDSTRKLTVSPSYGGGSVTCDTADGQYDVVEAIGASRCCLLYAFQWRCLMPFQVPSC